MFYGRKTEISLLDERYNSENFEFVPIYGRRRVGKTTLLREFSKNKEHIFFTASEGTLEYNMSRLASQLLGTKVNANMDTVIELIRKKSENRFLLIIDEYPRLVKRSSEFQDRLQELIDEIHQDSKLFLILCGSSMSIMEHQVLGYKSPLYGRRTGSLKLEPLNLWESMEFLSDFDKEDALKIYSMVGGIPLYLMQFRSSESLENNIIRNFLRQDSFFSNEHLMTLIEEFENPATYYSVLTAVASGKSRASEISDYARLDAPTTTKFLTNLESIGIVTKERPVDNPAGKMTRYHISDKFMKFQFRRVLPITDSGMNEKTMAQEILRLFETDMGFAFESICAEFMKKKYGGKIGKWWGSDPESKIQHEIDLILTIESNGKRFGMFAECKYKNEEMSVDELDTLIYRSSLVKGYDDKKYILFSKTGFDFDTAENTEMYTLKDILDEKFL